VACKVASRLPVRSKRQSHHNSRPVACTTGKFPVHVNAST
jgi:hypothetical protein